MLVWLHIAHMYHVYNRNSNTGLAGLSKKQWRKLPFLSCLWNNVFEVLCLFIVGQSQKTDVMSDPDRWIKHLRFTKLSKGRNQFFLHNNFCSPERDSAIVRAWNQPVSAERVLFSRAPMINIARTHMRWKSYRTKKHKTYQLHVKLHVALFDSTPQFSACRVPLQEIKVSYVMME